MNLDLDPDDHITADLHIGDTNMARLRGFSSVGAMAEYVISLWNAVVVGRVWVLGDFIMKKWGVGLLDRMAGDVWLVRGNHDPLEVITALNKHARVYVGGWVHQVGKIVLTHEPVVQQAGLVNLHGHTHGVGLGDVGIWTWGRIITVREALCYALSADSST